MIKQNPFHPKLQMSPPASKQLMISSPGRVRQHKLNKVSAPRRQVSEAEKNEKNRTISRKYIARGEIQLVLNVNFDRWASVLMTNGRA